MPRVEEVQFVHWGSLRPDPIPLLPDGINVATGPNGSGKTCFLDGVKLLLGVTDFSPGRTPGRYIYDGSPNAAPADRALLRATFANPPLGEGRPRLFAPAGHGCEDAEQVSVVCMVTPDTRRYLVLPGRIRWGVSAPLESDLRAFLDAYPQDRWLDARRYDDLLHQAGVTRALRGVLALPQGASDRLVEERPAGLLRKLLQLTGKQASLEELHRQRERLERARIAYLSTMERYQAEQRHLSALDQLAARYRDYARLRDQLDHLRAVLLPAAEYRDLRARVEQARAQRDRELAAVRADERQLEELRLEVPSLEAEVQALADRGQVIEGELGAAGDELRELDGRIAALRARIETARQELAQAEQLGAGLIPEGAEAKVKQAEDALARALVRQEELTAALKQAEAEAAALRAGKVPAPADVEAFRARLAEAGIEAALAAEAVDVRPGGDGEQDRVRAESALGDLIWALVVPSESYRRAVQLAAEAGYRWPVAPAGFGEPHGVLERLDAPPELGYLLEVMDAWPAVDAGQAHHLAEGGQAAVTREGMCWRAGYARLHLAERPILGAAARKRRLAELEARAGELRQALDEVGRQLPELRTAVQEAVRRLDAVRKLPALREAQGEAERELAAAEELRPRLLERQASLISELRRLDAERGDRRTELRTARERQASLESRLVDARPRLAQREARLRELEAELAGWRLTAEQRAALADEGLPGTEALTREEERLAEELARFPDDVRNELLLAQRDAQARVVEDTDRLAAGRKEDMAHHEARVQEARQRYLEHVEAAVRLLDREFTQVCQATGARGAIKLVRGDKPEDLGVDVLVAHREGEPLRSYRDPGHSGGQRAKVAMLLLLAAMGAGGSADLLVMDEHIAHLDSTNIDYIAELMRSLRPRVQFLLATPTNAESLRLGWCDLQLTFLPREPGQPYSPPIRLLTRLGAGDLERRLGLATPTTQPPASGVGAFPAQSP